MFDVLLLKAPTSNIEHRMFSRGQRKKAPRFRAGLSPTENHLHLFGQQACCVLRNLVHNRHRVLDRLDDLADVEGLLEEAIEAGGQESLALLFAELAAHGDDL